MINAERSIVTLTVAGRLVRTKGTVVYMALALAALPLLVKATWVSTEVLQGPNLGLFVSGRMTVDYADARWTGVDAGDRVLAVQGIRPQDLGEIFALQAAAGSGPVVVRFGRGDRLWDVEAQPSGWLSSQWLSAAVRMSGGGLLIAIALLVFLLRPGGATSWLFLLFCYLLGLFQLLSAFWFAGNWLFYLQYGLLPLAASLGLHLFLLFPLPITTLYRQPWLAGLLYLPCAVLPPLVFVGLGPDNDLAPVGVAGEYATWLWGSCVALIASSALVFQYRRAKRNRHLHVLPRFHGFFLGIGILMVATLLATLNQVLGVLHDARLLWQFTEVAQVAFAAITAYTLVRHNPLDIDRFAAALVGYAVTTVVLLVGYALVVLGIPFAIGRLGLARSPILLIAVTAAASIAVRPLHRQVKKRLARFFAHDDRDAVYSMRALQDLIEIVQTEPDQDQALAVVSSASEILSAEHAALWTLTDDGAAFIKWVPKGEPATTTGVTQDRTRDDPVAKPDPAPTQTLGRGSELGRELGSHGGGVHGLAVDELDPKAQPGLWELGLAMSAPVRGHGGVLGFLGVGRKRSGRAYPRDELAFLRAVAAQGAVVLEHLEGDTRNIGRYRLIRRLGIGGMAEVFLASHSGPGGFERRVALKRPLPDLAEDANCMAMFLDEARIAALLHHRNIVQVYDIDRQHGSYFIALEYMDGPSLRSVLKMASGIGRPLPPTLAVTIIDSVLAALEHAHQPHDTSGRPLAVVHRDVTPGNILINSAGEVKLTDFGLSRAASRLQRTQTGVVRGTIPYMSPEQGHPQLSATTDLRSDIYSAGAVLYEALCLERAFPQGPNSPRPAPPSKVQSLVPPALDAVFARATQTDRDQRYASAARFRVELQAAIEPEHLRSEESVARWLAELKQSYDRSHQPQPIDEAVTYTTLDLQQAGQGDFGEEPLDATKPAKLN